MQWAVESLAKAGTLMIIGEYPDTDEIVAQAALVAVCAPQVAARRAALVPGDVRVGVAPPGPPHFRIVPGDGPFVAAPLQWRASSSALAKDFSQYSHRTWFITAPNLWPRCPAGRPYYH